MAVGVVLILLVFEAARRVMGIALPIICGLFLAYALARPIPARGSGAPGLRLDQLVNQLSFGTEGLYGTPTTSQPPTSFCSSCSAPFWSRPG
jgi:TRAP-type uncharacterized transport system fused permease subunit